jgi:hypothetical protein
VILFGSVARGEDTLESDVDFEQYKQQHSDINRLSIAGARSILAPKPSPERQRGAPALTLGASSFHNGSHGKASMRK